MTLTEYHHEVRGVQRSNAPLFQIRDKIQRTDTTSFFLNGSPILMEQGGRWRSKNITLRINLFFE